MPFLSAVPVTEVVTPAPCVVTADATATDALGQLAGKGRTDVPVVDGQGRFLGTVSAAALADLAEQHRSATVRRVVDVTAPSVASGAALDVAVEALGIDGAGWVAVVDSGQRLVGIVTAGDVIHGYRRAVAATLERLSDLSGRATSLELRVGPTAPVATRTVATAGLPDGVVVVTVEHDGALAVADGTTALLAGDVVTLLVPVDAEGAVRTLLLGTPPTDDPGGPPQPDGGGTEPEEDQGSPGRAASDDGP